MENSSEENSLLSKYSLITHIPIIETTEPTRTHRSRILIFSTISINITLFIISVYFSIISFTITTQCSSLHFIFLSLSIVRVIFFTIKLLFSLSSSDYTYYILFHLYFGDLLLVFCAFALTLKHKEQNDSLGLYFYLFVGATGWYITMVLFIIGFLLLYLYCLEINGCAIDKVFISENKDCLKERKCIKCKGTRNGKYFVEFKCKHTMHLKCLKDEYVCESCPDCGVVSNNEAIQRTIELIALSLEFL